MTATVIPSPEFMVVDYLLTRPEVVALVASGTEGLHGISTSRVLDGSCVRVTRLPLGAPPMSWPLYVDRAYLQVDCWAGTTVGDGDATAETLANTVRVALADSFVGVHPGGTVSDVVFGSFGSLPDDSFSTDGGPARSRYICQVIVTVHP